MAKNIRLQVLMEPNQYNNLKEHAIEKGINYKNDSDLIRKILHKATVEDSNAELTTYIMKDQIKQQKEKIEKQNTLIRDLQNKRIELQNEIERLQELKKKKGPKKKTNKKGGK